MIDLRFYSVLSLVLDYTLDDLEALMQERTLLVCTLNKNSSLSPLEEFRRGSRLS